MKITISSTLGSFHLLIVLALTEHYSFNTGHCLSPPFLSGESTFFYVSTWGSCYAVRNVCRQHCGCFRRRLNRNKLNKTTAGFSDDKASAPIFAWPKSAWVSSFKAHSFVTICGVVKPCRDRSPGKINIHGQTLSARERATYANLIEIFTINDAFVMTQFSNRRVQASVANYVYPRVGTAGTDAQHSNFTNMFATAGGEGRTIILKQTTVSHC